MNTFDYKYPNYVKIIADNSELITTDEKSTESVLKELKKETEKESKSKNSKSSIPKNVSASNINKQLSVTVSLDEYSKYLNEIWNFINVSGIFDLDELKKRLRKSMRTKAENIFGRNDVQIKNDMIIRIIIATLAINHVNGENPDGDISFTFTKLKLDDDLKAALLKQADKYLKIIKSNSNGDFRNSKLVPFNIAILPPGGWTSIEYKKILNAERANMGSFAVLLTSYFIPLFLLKHIVDLLERTVILLMPRQNIIPLAFIRSINFVAIMLKGALNKREQEECVRITSLLDDGKYKLTFDENNRVNANECDTKFKWNLLSRTRCRNLAKTRNKLSSKYNKKCMPKSSSKSSRKSSSKSSRGGRRTRKKYAGSREPNTLVAGLLGLGFYSGVLAAWTSIFAAAFSNPVHPNYPVAAVFWFITNILGSITGCCAAIGVLDFGSYWIKRQIEYRRERLENNIYRPFPNDPNVLPNINNNLDNHVVAPDDINLNDGDALPNINNINDGDAPADNNPDIERDNIGPYIGNELDNDSIYPNQIGVQLNGNDENENNNNQDENDN
jgi:hypothetical protein